MVKTITLLGATGSIGSKVLELVRLFPNKFRIEAVSANKNWQQLVKIIEEFKPSFAVIDDEAAYYKLRDVLGSKSGCKLLAGKYEVTNLARKKADLVVMAISGSASLEPSYAAVEAGNKLAIASKEAIVCAGELLMTLAKNTGSKILPIDSEHNGIWQIIQEDKAFVEHITLTASGGPFWQHDIKDFAKITPEEAIAHPNWRMGIKNSLDSATMANKGLEIIEASYLFDIPAAKIKVVIHPESIIHGLVQYSDGSVIAQMSMPDMIIPISTILEWPQRQEFNYPKLDLVKLAKLRFAEVDYEKFPALSLAEQAIVQGGIYPLLFNVANEVAGQAFMEGRLSFVAISEVIRQAFEQITLTKTNNISEILQQIEEVANKVIAIIK